MSADSHGHSPLSQFEVYPIIPLEIGGYDLSFTNASLWMVISVAVVVVLMALGSRKAELVPDKMQSFAELLVDFIRNMITGTCGEAGLKYFPYIFTLFMFIVMCNLMGMVPYSFTVTSHIIVTVALAVMAWGMAMAINIKENGVAKFLAHFVPLEADTPMVIKLLLGPLLFVIEMFSYFVRPFSLSIRLAANMMAGHTLLKVIAGFVYALGVFGVLPLALVIVLVGFEIGIAILQAYIFTILTCVYLSEAFAHHH